MESALFTDFGITHDDMGWSTEVLDEGTSDHYPILFQSPLFIPESSTFRVTSWKIFSFLMNLTYEYWLSMMYNHDEQFFLSFF